MKTNRIFEVQHGAIGSTFQGAFFMPIRYPGIALSP